MFNAIFFLGLIVGKVFNRPAVWSVDNVRGGWCENFLRCNQQFMISVGGRTGCTPVVSVSGQRSQFFTGISTALFTNLLNVWPIVRRRSDAIRRRAF